MSDLTPTVEASIELNPTTPAGKTSEPRPVATPQSDSPAAGICDFFPGDLVVFEIYPDITSTNARQQIKADFRAMVARYKHHPAILMWAIGNELMDYGLYRYRSDDLFSLVNERAGEAHAEEGTNAHPVTMPMRDDLLIKTIQTRDPRMPNLDVWSAHLYRGRSFGGFFGEYAPASSKPLLITEFGVDAYDNRYGREYEAFGGTPYQATFLQSMWDDLTTNSYKSVCVGACVAEYSDEWWKGTIGSMGSGCPEADPCTHGRCGTRVTGQPDDFINEEWLGIVRPVYTGGGLDVMEPRAAYSALRSLWKTGALGCHVQAAQATGSVPFTAVFRSTPVGSCTTGMYYRWDFDSDGTIDVEGTPTSSLRQALDDYERDYIRRSMAENKGNKEATAERLGIDLATLYRKLKKLRIETP
ncbi:MAG: hypothetical protein HGA82_00725 [Anaerolineales bacterium]|nr:hypothetical protein [Anaerolineales bacterium]